MFYILAIILLLCGW